jgi:hypothetical protein
MNLDEHRTRNLFCNCRIQLDAQSRPNFLRQELEIFWVISTQIYAEVNLCDDINSQC